MAQNSRFREKLLQTALLQGGVTAAGMALDYLINAVLLPGAYTPMQTLAICMLVGTPFNWWNTSLRLDAQHSRRALAVSQAARADALHRLELALEAAEAANRAKSSFLATMSHEIRTPLNGVLGMADAMAAGPLAPEQRERLEVVRHCGQALLAQLNDVLDLSKIEAGRLELETIEFDLALVVDGAAGAFAALARAKGLAFTLDIDGARGAYRGDPTRLRQVLSNLISNALKFTESGEIRVVARYEVGRLQVAVRDTGIGMSAQALETLFAKYAQAEASTSRRFGGTGLGLAICRELVEMMGGAIEAASQPGEGTAFTFSIPLERIELQPLVSISAEADAQLPALRVLAADDNPINRLVIKTLLQQVGIEPVVVEDGAAAVEAWRRGAFDLILMDARMPGMDGMAATRAIRATEAGSRRPRTPIVALTADVMAHQLAEFRAAGMDGHVAKPVEAVRLFETIEAVLAGEDAEQRSEAAVG
ncbi:MAG TPA: ATP-binding protein [Caulobacteraceae bacterium]|nr:ATP-binding protein [Caulobacteraceae bacterium]